MGNLCRACTILDSRGWKYISPEWWCERLNQQVTDVAQMALQFYLSAWVWSDKCAFHLHYHGSYQFQECVNEMISITFLAPTLIYLPFWQNDQLEIENAAETYIIIGAVARHVDQYLRHILIHVVNMSIWFHYIVSAARTYKHEPRVTTQHQELTSQKQIRYEYKNGSWIDDLCFPGMVSKFQDRPIYLDGNLKTSGRIGPYDRDRWEQKHRKQNRINRMIGSFHHPKERPTPIYKNRWVPIYYSMCHWHPLPTRQGTRTSQATFRGATKCRGRMRKMIRKRPGAGASPWNQNTKGRTGTSGRTKTK